MNLSRLLSVLLLLTAAFSIVSCALSVQELAAQQSGTISIIIGGTTSTSSGSTSHTGGGGGGGGWESCTLVPGGITCVFTQVTSTTGGGGEGGSSTTVLTTQTSSPYTDSGGGNTTETSTTTSIPEFRTQYILLISAIGLTLVFCAANNSCQRKDGQSRGQMSKRDPRAYRGLDPRNHEAKPQNRKDPAQRY